MERRSSQRVDEPTPEQKRLDVWTLAAFTGLLALAGAVSHWLGKVLDPAGPPLLGVEAVAGMGRREEDLSPEELRRWRALQRRLYHESGLGEARARDPSAGPPSSEYERAMADKHGTGASSRAGAPGADEASATAVPALRSAFRARVSAGPRSRRGFAAEAGPDGKPGSHITPQSTPQDVPPPRVWARDINGQPNPGLGNVLISYFMIGVGFTVVGLGLYSVADWMSGGTSRTVSANSPLGRALSDPARPHAASPHAAAKPPPSTDDWAAASAAAIAQSSAREAAARRGEGGQQRS
ncbi:hypothetical protein FNF29_04922 [Cafeteria roenbergensis]|uniref:Transmembrane protein n=1 Tax=Cafeteria roenbergensis TaxID=33653 RepID=A0A5A8CD19_CAFRO|nr:hypothetical protein FNF29_04922 [Cafeteria roenbergensis]|eukprot:KAA0151033.1 hypothetical protein FNF29_04922 [Cafeteria roenbergensis]